MHVSLKITDKPLLNKKLSSLSHVSGVLVIQLRNSLTG